MIEVSIEGAKGVLFNVTGGYDMSMSEIQEAAEIITNAVSPDANIIFGATLKPDLEDELIITVIATGFDSEHFEEQVNVLRGKAAAGKPATTQEDDEDDDVPEVDMDLTRDEVAAEFAAEETADIWHQPPEEDDESDMPAFLRRRKKLRQMNEDE